MNTLIIRCILACTILWTAIPYAVWAGDTTKTSNKEIIIVNYDQLSKASLTDLASYASELWLASDNRRITITEYITADDAARASKITKSLVATLVDLGVNKDNISLQQADNQGSSAYFSISIEGYASVQ